MPRALKWNRASDGNQSDSFSLVFYTKQRLFNEWSIGMPVNALRKFGARMSLQEALERMEKLKLTHNSNEHEAALAALRLKTFDIHAARAPRVEEPTATSTPISEAPPNNDRPIPILDALPDVPYETLDELEAHQLPDKKTVNWDELHVILLQKA